MRCHEYILLPRSYGVITETSTVTGRIGTMGIAKKRGFGYVSCLSSAKFHGTIDQVMRVLILLNPCLLDHPLLNSFLFPTGPCGHRVGNRSHPLTGWLMITHGWQIYPGSIELTEATVSDSPVLTMVLVYWSAYLLPEWKTCLSLDRGMAWMRLNIFCRVRPWSRLSTCLFVFPPLRRRSGKVPNTLNIRTYIPQIVPFRPAESATQMRQAIRQWWSVLVVLVLGIYVPGIHSRNYLHREQISGFQCSGMFAIAKFNSNHWSLPGLVLAWRYSVDVGVWFEMRIVVCSLANLQAVTAHR